MHRIDTLTAVKDKFGPGKNGFTDGNIRTGRLATWLNSAMWDAIQEEICGVIEKAGIELNKEEHDQLYKAILLLVGGAINEEALLIKNNLSDVEDKDEAVENLGLKPTVDKAKNAVQRDGDTMTGELKIRGVNALRIFNDAFGLIFRRSEECLHLIPTQENQGENGDIGPLRPFTINLRTGEISMSHKVSVGGGSQVNGALGIGVQNALGGNSIAFGDNDTGLKQNGDGLLDVYANGQHVFRFQNGALQSNRAVNVSGRVTPSDYGNFDARYQTKTGGVQDVRYGSEMYYNPGGNEITWTFRSPSGHGLSGIYVQDTGRGSADNIGGVYYRPLQKLINGTWYNVASV
ncbi:TPA: phage tail protein [Escherichia coli]|uniref:phage tail protein n=2 Tax=Escherichia coli TaxID=562 RepID=UPI000DA5A1A9|nr:phage tail protein [Escherichia coli]EES3413008.1 phage tail protein [Escherichia coli]EES9564036.1 phage tail protein [Escherichia coli]EET9654233.1 phage tail protein [Escherichia coli]EEU1617285.1 phage tail protein [Escherichia coli]EEV9788467.1 phage tail protein [Escherichia coli]